MGGPARSRFHRNQPYHPGLGRPEIGGRIRSLVANILNDANSHSSSFVSNTTAPPTGLDLVPWR
jgi:hypothetical protein